VARARRRYRTAGVNDAGHDLNTSAFSTADRRARLPCRGPGGRNRQRQDADRSMPGARERVICSRLTMPGGRIAPTPLRRTESVVGTSRETEREAPGVQVGAGDASQTTLPCKACAPPNAGFGSLGPGRSGSARTNPRRLDAAASRRDVSSCRCGLPRPRLLQRGRQGRPLRRLGRTPTLLRGTTRRLRETLVSNRGEVDVHPVVPCGAVVGSFPAGGHRASVVPRR